MALAGKRIILTGGSGGFVAKKIVTAIKQRKKDVYIGFPERLFVRVNAVMPRLVDAAVASGDRKATTLFTT